MRMTKLESCRTLVTGKNVLVLVKVMGEQSEP